MAAALALVGAAAVILVVAVAWPVASGAARPASVVGGAGLVQVVAAENFYGDVVRQVGGARAGVTSIIDDPSVDPHSYESSTADASAVGRAALVVQNGLGYDPFMQQLEASSPHAGRVVVDVGRALGRKDGDNPHQWYDPATMPRVAALVAADLTRLDPRGRAYYAANLRRIQASLEPWMRAIAALRRRYTGTPVAVTEPVFGYAAAALGLDVRTPRSFQLAIQEGNDPAPQDVQAEQALLTGREVRALFYNVQAVEPATRNLLGLARAHRVPIVAVYETMPRGETYQGWMLAEMRAVGRALGAGASTERIG